MAFRELSAAMLEPEMAGVVGDVLSRKMADDEKVLSPRIPEMDAWINTNLAELEARIAAVEPARKLDWSPIDEVFRGIVAGSGALTQKRFN